VLLERKYPEKHEVQIEMLVVLEQVLQLVEHGMQWETITSVEATKM